MSIFSFLRGTDINQAIHNCRQTPGAVLVDVRTPQEYQEGHISGSINVPLQSLGRISSLVSRKDTPVFVYCQSGGRGHSGTDGLFQCAKRRRYYVLLRSDCKITHVKREGKRNPFSLSFLYVWILFYLSPVPGIQ